MKEKNKPMIYCHSHLVNLSILPAGWSFERTRGDQLPFKAVHGQDHPGYPRPQPLHFRDQAVGIWAENR